MKRIVLPVLALIMLGVLGWGRLCAHESQPGTLELRQGDDDRYEVIWRAPIY